MLQLQIALKPILAIPSKDFRSFFSMCLHTGEPLEKLQSLPTSKQYSQYSSNLAVFNENLNPLYNFVSNCLTFPPKFVEIWYQCFNEVVEKSLFRKIPHYLPANQHFTTHFTTSGEKIFHHNYSHVRDKLGKTKFDFLTEGNTVTQLIH